MKRNVRFGVGAAVIAAATTYLMVLGIRETSAYYFEIAEFIERKDDLVDTDLKIAGRVQPGSIEWDPRSLDLSFSIGDFGEGKESGPSIPVRFNGIKPDMLAAGRDVIIEGVYRDGVLEADKVMTSCPSKYEADLEKLNQPSGAQQASLPAPTT